MAKKLKNPIAHQFGTIENLDTLDIRSEDYEGLVQAIFGLGDFYSAVGSTAISYWQNKLYVQANKILLDYVDLEPDTVYKVGKLGFMFIGNDKIIRTVLDQQDLLDFAEIYPPKKAKSKKR